MERDDDDNVDEENWGIARKMRTRMLYLKEHISQ